MSSTVELNGSPRRRPPDRRRQIVRAAAHLFWERGYRQVGMADVAGRVEIGASALYRHFRGKSDLLGAVLDEAIGRLEAAAEAVAEGPAEAAVEGSAEGAAGGSADLVAALAEAVLARPEYAPLWHRTAGELPEAVAGPLRARRARILLMLGEAGQSSLRATRARAALAVLESPAQYHLDTRPEGLVDALRAAAVACLTSPVPDGAEVRPQGGHLVPRLRGEALMASAGRLFAERGYHAVSLGDIGAAVGISGPSVYQDYPSKVDLLAAILHRGNEVLWFDLHRVLASASDPSDALTRLVAGYTDVVGPAAGVTSALLTEVADLPDGPREEFRAARANYLAEWAALLRECRPELTEPSARLLACAALAVITTLTGPGEALPANQVCAFARATLGLPASD